MSDQSERASLFRALHVPGDPLILFNIWDAGSAKAVAAAGAKALATGSWSVAAAHGYEDGEALPLELALANLRRICSATDLPVTLDLETGYGEDPEAVGETAAQAIEAGAIGCNLEDSLVEGRSLRELGDAAARVAAARRAADRSGVPFFVNARSDVFFGGADNEDREALVAAGLERARAYAEAGADGLFLPGLADEELIGRITAESPLPVNLMVTPSAPAPGRLAALGAARLSYGPGPYRLAMQAVENAARAVYGEARP